MGFYLWFLKFNICSSQSWIFDFFPAFHNISRILYQLMYYSAFNKWTVSNRDFMNISQICHHCDCSSQYRPTFHINKTVLYFISESMKYFESYFIFRLTLKIFKAAYNPKYHTTVKYYGKTIVNEYGISIKQCAIVII